MQVILDFLSSNYYWILIIVIIILLAIIGYYADKTNFGQENDLEADDSVQIFSDKNEENEFGIANQIYNNYSDNGEVNVIQEDTLKNSNSNNAKDIEEKSEPVKQTVEQNVEKKKNNNKESEFERLYFETNSEYERVIEDSTVSSDLDNLLLNNGLSNVVDDNLFDELTTSINISKSKNKFELDELNKKIDLPKIDSLKDNKKNVWDNK